MMQSVVVFAEGNTDLGLNAKISNTYGGIDR